MEEFITDIPTWDNGVWTRTTFNTRDEFKDFITSLFKQPGEYRFNKDTLAIGTEQAQIYYKQKYYCSKPFKSKDFIDYWEDQKNKCRKGLIIKSGKDTWFFSRDYYMWLNFLPIYDKEKAKFGFAKLRDAQYHMALYELLAELNYKHAAILKKRQIASEQPHSEPVLGEHGWTTMGAIQPGDKLWNPDGTLTTVLHKSNNGLSDVYEFKFGDGRTTRCGIEHNWEVYDRAAKKVKVLNTKELLDLGLFQTPIKGIKKVYDNYRFSINTCKPIALLSNPVPVDSYTLGALLGDGHINNKSIYIAGEDDEVFDNISKNLGPDYVLKTTGYLKKSITYLNRFNYKGKEYKNSKFGVNPLLRECLELGLGKAGKSTKFIPEIYKTASVKDRIALIQGLMDTDGYINSTGNDIHFTNVNKRLIDDFTEVIRSLGVKAKIDLKENEHGLFYRVRISGNIDFELFKLTRKADRFKKRKSKNTFNKVPLLSITKLDYQEESSCIVVDNPNHLYITRDYIVTHNSYFHAGKLINQLWFEEGVTLKMGAALKDYINEKGTWKFLDEYANFLNEHTAWYRPMNPMKVLMWQQKIEERVNGRTRDRGLKGTIQGMSFEKDPTNSVGGPVKYFFHEEAGIAPKMDQTYEYIRPALKSGFVTTGLFIAAGSVGDLDQCEPLKDMIMQPIANDIFPVETNLLDENGTIGLSGLFIPEQWSMPPYIDEFGNSLVKEALEALDKQFAEWKKQLTPEQYQLRISQHPRNIKEAFASRSVSKFPLGLLAKQEERIKNKEYPYEFLDIFENHKGLPEVRKTSKIPISEFPVSKKLVDKEGVLVVWERPIPDPEFGLYYVSIDPVSEGKSTTSESLCSIFVYKRKVEVTKINGSEVTTYIERDKIVASWCGRFDDINKTHERLRLIIEWYNAKAVVENNISLFINYMISKNKQKYLVRKDEMVFLKDLGYNTTVYQEYGWKNTGRLFKDHLLSYCIEFLKESIDEETKDDGTVVRTTYGVERIPDPMLIVEMKAYEEGLNVDRLVAFAALVAYIKILESNIGFKKRVEKDDAAKNLDKSSNLFKLNKSPFKHIGGSNLGNRQGFKRSAFKNIK